MKSTFTYSEAVDALRKHYGFGPEIPIEIQRKKLTVKPTVPETCSFEKAQARHLISEVQKLRMFSDEKIPAIRKVRELGGYGLGDAKFIVENWGEFVISCNTFKRLPKLSGLDGSFIHPPAFV